MLLNMFQRKRKFVLVDPSFDGKGGDKWQYAMAFMDSAKAQDFEFILLANKKSPLLGHVLGMMVDQRNIFDYGFYMHGDIAGRHYSTPLRRAIKTEDVSTNQKISKINSKISEAREHADYVGVERWSAEKASILEERLQSRAYQESIAELNEPLAQPFNRDDFAIALARELAKLNLSKGDILFLHTATQGMMESLSELSTHLAEPLDIDSYFLFHFGASAPDARTFIDRYHSYSNFETLALRLKSGSPFKRIFLLATSSRLRDELEAQFGLPVGIFDGLTNRRRYTAALGGENKYRETRDVVFAKLRQKRVLLGLRVADLDDSRIEAAVASVDVLEKQGFSVGVSLAYHNGNRAKAIQYITRLDPRNFLLVDTDDNDDYIKFLAESSLVVLPYRTEIYEKRVSAVLHDCAVLGVSCVVPRGTPLEDGRDYADIYAYSDVCEIPGAVLRAATTLSASPERSEGRMQRATELFSSDVIERLTGAMAAPSLTVEKRGPTATVVMPLWGRVGSSYAIEAQIRFLLERGYFVIQVFALDKPAEATDAIPFFWRMLYENSLKMRANVQRIAYRTTDVSVTTLPEDTNGFDLYLANIGSNMLWDDQIEKLTTQSTITIVNHVFNSKLAKRIGGGKFILETHDIQCRQMVHWPIRNPYSFIVEPYDKLLESELKEVETFDFVVNVSSFEHQQLTIANPRSRIITPYIPPNRKPQQYESIGAMSYNHQWDERFRGIYKFDFLLLGDSHPANLESAVWFMEKVFFPHLRDKSFTLGIVGRVCSHLKERYGEPEDVYYCGFVDDIADVRALSNVIVLPDQRGSGISIKTLETLAYASAFVGTDVAFRGLSDLLSKPPPTTNDPFSFAQRLRQLAQNENERKALGSTAWEMYLSLAEKAVFENAWREVLQKLGLSH